MDPENSLQLGIAAYKSGEKEKAHLYLRKAVREFPDNEQAWGWLFNVALSDEERMRCMRRVIQINPANEAAAKLLKELEDKDWTKFNPTETAKVHNVSPSPSLPEQQIQEQTKLRSTASTISQVSTILIVIGVVIMCCIPIIAFLLQR